VASAEYLPPKPEPLRRVIQAPLSCLTFWCQSASTSSTAGWSDFRHWSPNPCRPGFAIGDQSLDRQPKPALSPKPGNQPSAPSEAAVVHGAAWHSSIL